MLSNFRSSYIRFALVLLTALFAVIAPVGAAVLLQVNQTCATTQASIRYGETFNFELNYANSSLNASAQSAKIEDVLDSHLEFVGATNSVHVDTTAYDSTANKVTIYFKTPMDAGAVGSVVITVKFKLNTTLNYLANNSVTASGSNSDPFVSNSVTVKAIQPPPPVLGLAFANSMSISKVADYSEVSQNRGLVSYSITHGTNYAAGTTMMNYRIADTMPANYELQAIVPEQWATGNTSVNIFYRTNLDSSLRAWPGNPRYTTSPRSTSWIATSEVSLVATERITGVEMRYGNLAGGGAFHPSNMTAPLQFVGRLQDATSSAVGATLTNCANVSATNGASENSCANSTVTKAKPEIFTWFEWVWGNYPPFLPDTPFKLSILVANSDTSTATIINPKFGIVLPPELEFLGLDTIMGLPWLVAGSPAPTVAVVNNFQGNGSTLVRFLWGTGNPLSIPPATNWQSIRVLFNVKAKATTVNGDYQVAGYSKMDVSYTESTSNASGCQSSVFKDYTVIARNNLAAQADVDGKSIAKNYTATQAVNLAGGLFGATSDNQTVQIQSNIVNGSALSITNGSLFIPSVAAYNGRTINFPGGGWAQNYNGPNFSSTFSGIQIASGLYAAMPANSTVTIPGSPGPTSLVVGSSLGVANVAVFNVVGNTLLNNANVTQLDLNLNGKTPNAILINCTGNTTFGQATLVGNLTSTTWRPKILWNFPDGTTVTLNRTVYGSILAPNASVSANSGSVEGAVYANNVSNTVPIHQSIFAGVLCPSTSTTYTVTENGVPWLSWRVSDDLDWDGNLDFLEQVGKSEANVTIQSNGGQPALTALMKVKGELDTTWSAAPDTGLTTPSGSVDYSLEFKNEAGVAMKNLVVINILPHVGDKGVIQVSPRGSTFAPYLAAPISAPNATTYYSLAGYPCRDELTPGIPVGCTPAAWTNVPPADLTTVKSIKLDFGNTNILPSETMTISWPMRVPINAPTGAADVAWNSFGYSVARADNGVVMLPSEPRMTGVKVDPPVPPFYGNFVWLDANQDGIQTAGETGVNSIRVDLYKDNGDNIRDMVTDTFIKFTTTAGGGFYQFANMTPGNYYAVVQIPNIYGISPVDQGGFDDKDSDGEASQFGGGRVALMPITNLIAGEIDLTWDQGIFDRSGTPAVWASVPVGTSSVYIGGRFSGAGGTARKNVAKLSASGAVDTSFSPGTGCNQDVLSMSLLPNGSLAVGGLFTNYNGTAVSGFALLGASGGIANTVPAPDTPDVRWVQASGSDVFIAGKFFKVGGTDRDCIAKISSTGVLDTTFNTANGANDAINDAAVLPDGSVIAVGSFTTYAGLTSNGVVKINPNGTTAPNFLIGSGANNEVLAILVLADGRMVLSGRFTQFNGTPCRGNIRIQPNGSIDPSMSMSDLNVNSINSMN